MKYTGRKILFLKTKAQLAKYLTLFMVFTSHGIVFSQETIINLGISQPRELNISESDIVNMNPGESVTLGSSIVISGGSPAYTYLWHSGQVEIATSPTISVTSSGNYIIRISDSMNCSASDTITVIATSVLQAEYLPSCIVYPNPASSGVFIKTEPGNPVKSVEILTLSGKTLQTIQVAFPYSGDLDITISGLEQGSYILKIKTIRFETLKSVVKINYSFKK